MAALAVLTHQPLVFPSLGPTAYLLFAAPTHPAACQLALACTCGGMALSGLPHPPAGATTLIVALGILRTPVQLVDVLVGVVALVAVAAAFNRLTGVPYPLWRPDPGHPTTR